MGQSVPRSHLKLKTTKGRKLKTTHKSPSHLQRKGVWEVFGTINNTRDTVFTHPDSISLFFSSIFKALQGYYLGDYSSVELFLTALNINIVFFSSLVVQNSSTMLCLFGLKGLYNGNSFETKISSKLKLCSSTPQTRLYIQTEFHQSVSQRKQVIPNSSFLFFV